MTVKTGMQHSASAKTHSHMEDYSVTEEGNYVTKSAVGRFDFIESGSFLLVAFGNAEIRAFIKLNAEFPAIELPDESPAVKERIFSAVGCMSDKKIMIKPHT